MEAPEVTATEDTSESLAVPEYQRGQNIEVEQDYIDPSMASKPPSAPMNAWTEASKSIELPPSVCTPQETSEYTPKTKTGGLVTAITEKTTTSYSPKNLELNKPPLTLQETANASSFQYTVLENIIQDALEDFRHQIRLDIQNMHVELVRQFQVQKVSCFENNRIL